MLPLIQSYIRDTSFPLELFIDKNVYDVYTNPTKDKKNWIMVQNQILRHHKRRLKLLRQVNSLS